MKPHKIFAKFTIKGMAAAGLVLLASGLVAAATANWPFSATSEVTVSDAYSVEVSGGKLQLKFRRPFHQHDTKTEFDSGTYSDTEIHPGDIGTAQSSIKLNESGLVSYYPLNGTTGSIAHNSTSGLEDSKSTNEGAASNVNGTGLAFASGRFGNGVSFDGVDDQIQIPNLTLGTSHSASAWINPTSLTPGTKVVVGGGLSGTWIIRLSSSAMSYWNGSAAASVSVSVPTGVWSHVAVTRSNTTVTFYLNGAAIGSGELANNNALSNTNRIGSAHSSDYFPGLIDDVAIYTRALTVDEVQAQAQAGVAVHMEAQASLAPHAPKLVAGMPGLVAYWPMDESTGTTSTTDLAGYNKGTLNNMVSPGDHVTGVNGKGLNFNGSNKRVSVADNLALNKLNGIFTFSAWVKPATTGTYRGVYANGHPVNPNGGWEVRLGDDDKLWLGDSNWGGALYYKSTTTLTDTASWHHIAVVKNGTNADFYIDGVAAGSATVNATLSANGSTKYIGYTGSGGGGYFNGHIDEVALFSRALSAGEIAYLAGKRGETATYTSPVMDGEITTATWDKIQASLGKVTPGMKFVRAEIGASGNTDAVAVADMDGDGDLDIVGGRKAANGINWYENNVWSRISISAGVAAADIALADLTSDKAVDIVVADNLNGGVKWFKNDAAADPTFAEQTSNQISTDASPQAVAVGDIDNDGDLDVVAGFGGSTDKIVWYQSDGAATPTFTAQTAVVTGFDCEHLIVRDLNADGFLDIAAASKTDNKLTWFKGNGGSSWTTTNVNTTASTGWTYVGAADIDSDGDIDLSAAGNTNGHISWWANDGSATPAFSTKSDINTSYTSAVVALPVDLDNDGDMDMLTAAAGSADKVDWWQNNGSQNFGSVLSVGVAGDPFRVIPADLNGDGHLDLPTASASGSNDGYIFNSAPWTVSTISGGTIYGRQAVDINLDGLPDLLGTNGTKIGYRLQTGAGTFNSSTYDIEASFTASSMANADLNQDDKLDVIAYGTSGLSYWYQGANITTWTKVDVDTGLTAGGGVVRALDMDGDGRTDIVTAGDSKIRWWKQNVSTPGQFDAQTDIESTLLSGFTAMHVRDMNADGFMDVVTSHGNPNSGTHWYQQTSAGVFAAKSSLSISAFSLTLSSIVDLNSDGMLDFIYAGTNKYHLQTSPSPLTFDTTGVSVNSSSSKYFPADIDGDGDIDLVTDDASAGAKFVENVGSVTSPLFSSKYFIIYIWPTDPDHVLIADFNQDGMLDVVTDGSRYAQQMLHSKVSLQVRTGTTNPPTGNYTGPDATSGTFFGAVGQGAGVLSSLDAKRYAQYRAMFYRNDAALDPMLKNVRVEYTAKNYSTLYPNAVSANATTFSYLTSFAETGISEPAGSEILYQLSGDGGTTWKYYSGGWVTSNGTSAQANDPATINTNIATFDNDISLTANGSLKWRALLGSNGDVQPSVDAIDIGYEAVTLALTAPNGGEIWKAGKAHAVNWTASGLPATAYPVDFILEYNNAGSTTVFDQTIVTGVNPTHHNEELISGAAAVWHFGDATSGAIITSDTFADSEGSNTGTATNTNAAGMAYVAGQFGGGVSFDGVDDYVSIPDSASLNPGSALTLSAWIKPTAVNSSFGIINKNATNMISVEYRMQIQSGSLLFGAGASGNSVTSNAALSTGVWTHVAATYDGAIAKIYINGSLDKGAAVSWSLPNGTSPVTIGRSMDNGGTIYYPGVIDEAAIFNRALSAAEIAALATANPGYVWTAPAENSNQIRVRMRSPSAPAIRDVGDANATITDINITAPNGSEYLAVGGSKSITWSAASLAQLSDYVLEYTTAAVDPTSTGSDPLTTWVQIAASQSGAGGTYSWSNIPDSASSTARVRIRSAAATDLVDVSDANFSIAGLAITDPNGSNLLYEGEKYQITWGHGGTSLTDLILEYNVSGSGGWNAFSPAANNLSVRRGDSASLTAGLNPASIANAAGVWRMNEGVGTAVSDNVGANTGTTSGGPAWVDGQFHKALSFDGADDMMAIPNSAGLNITGNISMSAWVYPTGNPAVNFPNFIMAKGISTSYALYFGTSGFAAAVGNVNVSSRTFPSLNTWYHVAATYDGAKIRIYVNGILENAVNSTTNPFSSTAALYVSADAFGNGTYGWQGQLDDVAVFSRALTDAEIRKLAGGSYEWTVPDDPGVNGRVRIRSAAQADLTDATDGTFEIRARSVVVNSPNGSESWQEASRQTIQWTPAGLMSNNLTLEYCQGAGCTSPVTIATGVDAGGKPFQQAIGAWGFGEGTGQTSADKSGAGNNGTIGATSSAESSDPVFVLGKFGHALQFDGVDDRVAIPDSNNLDLSNRGTVSAWIKTPATTVYREIVNKAFASSSQDGYYLRITSGGILNMTVSDGTTHTAASAVRVDDNAWHHVLGLWDGANIKVFIDGVQSGGSTAYAGSSVANNLGVKIGNDNSSGFPFTGLIDDVQIYNRALTAAEITALGSGKANYPWIVPDAESATVRVKITDANRAASNDISDANFAITPRTVAVNAPNGSETFPYNTLQYIKWDATGPLSNNLTLKLDPDTTGGAVFPTTIASGVDAGGVPLSGAVGAWGFGEGTGTALDDKSPNANTGTLSLGTGGNTVNADAWKVGKLGHAVDFDGVDDKITVAHSASLNFGTGDFSFAMWLYPRNLDAGIVLGKGTGNNPSGWHINYSNGNNIYFKFADAEEDLLAPGGTNLSLNTWTHIVAVKSGTTLTIYKNGVSGVTATNASFGNMDNASAMGIGASYNGTSPSYGMMDEVHVYNRALTPAEITLLAQGRGVYPWTVPDPGFSAGTRSFSNSQVRVTDAGRPATTDDSNANFSLVTPRITITGPPPPNAVPFGAPQDITWTHNDTTQGSPVSTDLAIEYSIDGSSFPGGAQMIIAGSSANGGPVNSPFNWGVTSGAVSPTVKIRIQDNQFPYGEGITANFKVTGSLAMIKPNVAEKWAIGAPHTISWLRNGDITNVKIFTHNGNGTPITTVTSSTGAGAGSLSWTPQPGDEGTGLYMRVQDAADADVYDDSNVAFSISRVTVGNPASRLLANAGLTTTWTSTAVSNVKLEYSTNGTDFSTVPGASSLPAGNLSFNWQVPMVTTTNFIVRAVDADLPPVGDQALAFDASDTSAVIYGALQVLVPSSSGITWASGQQQTITWSSVPANANVIPNVRLLAAKDGNFNNSSGGNIVTITSTTPNHNTGTGSGSFNWTPNFTSTLVKVRVLDPADPAAVAGTAPGGQDVDDSNNFFTIAGISLTSPAGGETALVNGSFGITFGFTGVITNVDLHYSVNGGSSWTPIVTNFNVPTNPYTYNWTPVPNSISTNVKVRVRDSDNPSTVFAESLAFNVKGSINVTTPPTLYVNDPYTIQYTTTGSIPDVQIHFSPSGNFSGDEVLLGTVTGLTGAQTPTNQTFNWPSNVPNTIQATGRIRVTAINLGNTGLYPNGSPATSGTSGAFSIAPKFTITAPLASNEWGVSDASRNITWTTVGTVSNVKIEYAAENDSYASWVQVTPSTSNAGGSYSWNPIPDIPTLRGQNPQLDRDIMVKIRITDLDAGHPATVVESSPFKVKWYRVLWKVKDADSAALLQNLNVTDSSPWTINDFSLTQTIGLFRNYKQGIYTTSWEKQTGYAAATVDGWSPNDTTPDIPNGADMVREAFLQNDATANVPKQTRVEYSYDTASDTLTFRWWVEVKGKLETNQNLLGAGKIEIFNLGATTILQTINDADDEDANGLYQASWVIGNALDKNQLYFAKATANYNSQPQTSGVTIDLREKVAIAAIQTAAVAIDNKIGTVADAAGASTIFGKVAGIKGIVGSDTDTAASNTLMGKAVKNDIDTVKILDEVQTKIPQKIAASGNKGGRGQLLQRQTRVALGQTAAIRYQYDTGLQPVVSIYSPEGNLVVTAGAMKEVGTTGVYNYDWKLINNLKKGEYTVIVTEPSSGILDSMVLTVTTAGSSEEEIASAASSASTFAQNASMDARKTLESTKSIEESLIGTDGEGLSNQLTNMRVSIEQMKRNLTVLTGEAQEDGGVVTVAQVHDQVAEVMNEIKSIASQKGINLDSMYQVIQAQGESTQEIQNMVTAVEAAAKATQEIVEKANDRPVMTTWFETGGAGEPAGAAS